MPGCIDELHILWNQSSIFTEKDSCYSFHRQLQRTFDKSSSSIKSNNSFYSSCTWTLRYSSPSKNKESQQQFKHLLLEFEGKLTKIGRYWVIFAVQRSYIRAKREWKMTVIYLEHFCQLLVFWKVLIFQLLKPSVFFKYRVFRDGKFVRIINNKSNRAMNSCFLTILEWKSPAAL